MSLKALFSALFLALPATLFVSAQSDNFDSGALDAAWKRSHFNPALVNLSFPDGPTGKALRIQASPVPDAAPAAAMFYRDDLYTNFYLAVDIVSWPGTDKDQAIVLVARANLTANPATTTGIIMNYDASQEGEGENDRRQGQLQINMVTNDPPFTTKTLAVAEVTLVPGRPYRLVFKGEGSQYTGQAYDLYDLTRPIVTIHADDDIQGPTGSGVLFDSGFKSGKCGFLSFSRDGTTGTTDVTIDNYFAAAANPNPGLSPGIAHPVAGVPYVSSRTPGERFTNFHNPATGITFFVTANDTNAAPNATKLRLNGVEAPIVTTERPATGPEGYSMMLSAPLTANTVYNAQIEVQDITGTKKSTNTFWFDTFSDAYLAGSTVKTIEAEDYNFNGGEFLADPIPVSGVATDGNAINGGGVGYWEMVGVPDVDYHDARSSPEGTWSVEYRSGDSVGLSAGMFPEIEDLNESETTPVRRSDHVRARYASSNLLEFVVHRTEPGEWLNYTRDFNQASYTAYLRVASFGATDVELHRVTGDPKAPDQTTVKLGTFRVPNLFTRYNYQYVPLVNDQGNAVSVDLNGRQTLRLQMAGTPQDQRKIAMNYLLLLPQIAVASIVVESSATVNGTYTVDTTATIAPGPNGFSIPLPSGNRFYRLRAESGNPQIASARITNGTLLLTWTNAN